MGKRHFKNGKSCGGAACDSASCIGTNASPSEKANIESNQSKHTKSDAAAREYMLRCAPTWRLMLNMSVPAVLVTLVMVIYNMADVYFIGRTGNASQVAAIALAGPAYGLMQGMGALIGQGACTAAAIRLGKGDIEGARAMGSFCMWSAIVLGAALAIAGIFMAEDIAAVLGARGSSAGYAAGYLRILAAGAPAILVSSIMSNVARADGSVRAPMVGNMVGTVLNIALDPLLIDVCGMGVEGAALATVLGSVASCACIIAHAAKRTDLSLNPCAVRGHGALCLKAILLGLPMAVNTILGSMAGALGNTLLARHGHTAVAAMGVASKAGMLIGMFALGICMGIQPAISFNYGRGDIRRTLSISRDAALITIMPCAIMTVVFVIWRDNFVAAFIDEEIVRELGARMLAISMLSCPLIGVYQLCSSFMQATGHAAQAITLSAMRQGVLYLPCLYLGERTAGLNGIMWAAPVADICALAISLVSVFYIAARMKGREVHSTAIKLS